MTHAAARAYFEKKLEDLKEAHGLTTFAYDPCAIRTKDDLKSFVRQLANGLFEEDDYSFADETDADDSLLFTYKGQPLSLRIDQKFGHIEPDFAEVLDFMALLSGVMMVPNNIAMASGHIAGQADDMREAWAKGLPVHIPEVDFRHHHIHGKYFKKQEVGAVFIVAGSTTPAAYEKELLNGLNSFLAERSYAIRYTSAQLKAYTDRRAAIGASLNGDYCGQIVVDKDRMTVSNGLENQIFLSRYLDKYPDATVRYRANDHTEEQVVPHFMDFVATLGRDL